MQKNTPALDSTFIAEQKRRLLSLQQNLKTASQNADDQASDTREALQGEAHEYEDDAQHLTQVELSGRLGESIDRRLAVIDRALAKIADGTYGRSDASGQAIPIERLRALPEAVYTLQEQQAIDTRSGS